MIATTSSSCAPSAPGKKTRSVRYVSLGCYVNVSTNTWYSSSSASLTSWAGARSGTSDTDMIPQSSSLELHGMKSSEHMWIHSAMRCSRCIMGTRTMFVFAAAMLNQIADILRRFKQSVYGSMGKPTNRWGTHDCPIPKLPHFWRHIHQPR